MKRFVVAYADFYNNRLTQEVVQADTKQEARWKHSGMAGWDGAGTEDMNDEEFQAWCFNMDVLHAVMEI